MLNIIEKFLSQKTQRNMIYFCILSLMIYYSNNLKIIFQIIIKNLKDYPFAALCIVFLIAIKCILEKTNKISNMRQKDFWEEHMQNEFEHESEEYQGIQFVLEEKNKTNKKEIEIRINNKGTKILRSICGRVNLYDYGKGGMLNKILIKEFKYEKLKENMSGLIGFIKLPDKVWNFFDIEIDELQFEGEEKSENKVFHGTLIIRNYSWIFKFYELYDNEIWVFKTKYNLCYLKEKIHKFYVWIHFICSQHVYCFGDVEYEIWKDYRKDVIRKWMCRVTVVLIYMLLGVFLVILAFDFINFFVPTVREITDYLIRWFGLSMPKNS